MYILQIIETVDTLCNGTIQLIQAKNGYRFSLDPVLLADFVTLRDEVRVLDLGSGCGILLQLLASRSSELNLVGWELQAQMADRSSRSVELNGNTGQITMQHVDLRLFRGLTKPGVFDLVVTNPPY